MSEVMSSQRIVIVAIFTVMYIVPLIGTLAINEYKRRRACYAAFRAALDTWGNSGDWQGYGEIPATMYDQLVNDVAAVIERKRWTVD